VLDAIVSWVPTGSGAATALFVTTAIPMAVMTRRNLLFMIDLLGFDMDRAT
jgi:hypothetical protein